MHLAQTGRDPELASRSAFSAAVPAQLPTEAAAEDPQEFLHRLARTIQLMRLDHSDAHLYRSGCDALVQHAIGVSNRSDLEEPLSEIMRRVEVGDYHRALTALRALTQSGWRAC